MRSYAGKLISFIGPSDHLYVLLQPLQVLVCGEDNEIRDRALAATEDLIRRMTRSQIITHLLPMLKELSSKDWYTARSACALLCPAVFQLVDEDNRSVVLSLLSRCATDSTPSVRRSAAKALPKLAPSASPNHIQEIAQLFAVLAKDDQDSIRIQCIQADVALAVYFTIELQTKIIVPCAVAWSGDRSWRVRWSLGHHLHDLVGHIQEKNAAINPDVTKAVIVTLCTVYDSLLNDSEPEVRASSVSHFSALCSFLSRDAIHQLMVSVQRLCGDSSDFVRAAAATELSLLCTMLGREDTVNLLLPSLLQLLRDERSEVRLNIIAQLHSINDAIGVDALSQSLLPALSELGNHRSQ